MVINENNTHINSFTKGMNSDTAYDQIQNSQYTFAKNIRITKNQSLGGASDYSTLREGIVTPVPAGELVSDQYQIYGSNGEVEILSVDSVDDIHILVCSDEEDNLLVERINLDDYQASDLIWKGYAFFKGCSNKEVSTVLYKELDNVTKLYIATGIKPIIELRVDEKKDFYLDGNRYRDVDYLINNRIIPRDRVYINDVISGRLPASQVQYTYRFYNKYGNTTQLAPLTNKIQIIDSSRDKEIGNAEGTETSKGLQITIPVAEFKDLFDRMQVFRLTYIKPNEDSEIALIYDDKIKGDINTPFVLNDVGIEPLNVLTIEEFSAMSGLLLIPKHIENNQNYMFCANVEDDTIIKDVHIQYGDMKPVYTSVTLAKNCNGGIPQIPTDLFSDEVYIEDYPIENVTPQAGSPLTYYFEDRGVNSELVHSTYNDMFTSSLLRSLRRGEAYKYGIVYYDKYGRRSDVISLGDAVEIEDINPLKPQSVPFTFSGGTLTAQPIGMKITLPQPYTKDENNNVLLKDIIGCQIVRRSSSEVYQKTLLQVALARPVQQGLALFNNDTTSEKKSPFYPTGFLTTNDITITPPYYDYSTALWSYALNAYVDESNSDWKSCLDKTCLVTTNEDYKKFEAATKNKNLFQIFSSEIDYRRDDVLEKVKVSNTTIEECLYISPMYMMYGDLSKDATQWHNGLRFFGVLPNSDSNSGIIFHKDQSYRLSPNDKEDIYWVFNYFNIESSQYDEESTVKSIKDVKIPNWSDGFTNIQRNTNQNIIDAIKKYKTFTTTVDQYTYNNWISSCKYDLKPGHEMSVSNQTDTHGLTGEFIDTSEDLNNFLNSLDWADSVSDFIRCGYIGAGPSCFLAVTDSNFGTYSETTKLCTSICNIKHPVKTEDIESEEQVIYYGFGNYFKLIKDTKSEQYLVSHADGHLDNTMIVFDGDIYITPHEFTTMYKAYDFESSDTLQSTQITNYIPLESKVNTYFDYGKNLLNTNSSNLIYEPGQVEGIITQERPAHQYNMIYSDNDASNDIFTLISTDKDETNVFKQRAYFSEPKTNGEFIDNYQIFKPASFIDVDSKYGPITHMLTDKNSLFYWQENAFGKFSVNERSLINDTNGNTIMLGQAGILSRYDYISTKYGMREGDMCACPAAQRIFWVDINNKAVVAGNGEQAINYGEQLGVQNIINSIMFEDKPYVHHDLQNDELLCKISKDEQLIFNTKYNIATSLYTREYDDILNTKNHLYGLYIDSDNYLNIIKYNYLIQKESKDSFLSPMELQFVVNPNASITKVFDSQQIIPIKRLEYKSSQIDNLQSYFKTDLYDKVYMFNSDMWTDREGNILYNIPRFGNEKFGNRIRGKWMEVDFNTNAPEESTSISHVITKFRQSFS